MMFARILTCVIVAMVKHALISEWFLNFVIVSFATEYSSLDHMFHFALNVWKYIFLIIFNSKRDYIKFVWSFYREVALMIQSKPSERPSCSHALDVSVSPTWGCGSLVLLYSCTLVLSLAWFSDIRGQWLKYWLTTQLAMILIPIQCVKPVLGDASLMWLVK